jgi:CubicO group peptidase (beta-lactamase class C family)
MEVDVMSTGTQPLPHRVHWSHRWVVWLVAGLVVAAGLAVGIDRAFVAGPQTRSQFTQAILDGVVAGPNRLAPGATAYVSGPHGIWVGSAGVADVKTAQPMPLDARMRIESNSKTWLVAAVLQLVQEGKLSLDDTVDRWLPGLLRAHGSEITLRQLMSDSSGLIDDNDVFASPSAADAYLARVGDPRLREQLLAVGARIRADRAVQVSPLWFIRLAAWQTLVAPPGTTYHHSNIGWNIAGLIAAKASGKTLPLLYRERIFQPLRLRHTAYDPQGPIAGAHANGYALAAKGTLTDTTAWHLGKGADGAIVTDAKDEATFLTALTNGTLLDPKILGELGAGDPSGCAGPLVDTGSGAGEGFKSDVVYAVDGSRVAVLLLNGMRPGGTGFTRSAAAVASLYCAG